jgi:hypothetical protein
VLRRLGKDPDAETTTQDAVRAVTEHIQTRLNTAWNFWPWKELMVTEQRAFRPLWFVDRATPAGTEIYYQPLGYFKAILDAPAATVPTNGTYFVAIPTPYFGNIPFEQTGQRTIGQVFAAFNGDPDISNPYISRQLDFEQTENGIAVGYAGTSTAWITYRLPPPQFTSVPHAAGKIYREGDVVFDPDPAHQGFGECYVALVDDPENSAASPRWEKQMFPEMFADYVKLGAYSDALGELDNDRAADKEQTVMAVANRAASQAEEMLASLCNRQIEQGQRASYRLFQRRAWPASEISWPGVLLNSIA